MVVKINWDLNLFLRLRLEKKILPGFEIKIVFLKLKLKFSPVSWI